MIRRWLLKGFRPERVPHRRSPEDAGLPVSAVEEVSLMACDGTSLFAWFAQPELVPGNSAPALLAIHGWGSNAADLLPGTEVMRAAGFAVMVIDARCHGRSGDAEFTSMPRFAQDLEVALDWLQAHSKVDRHRVILLGHSVGAAAALLLASRRPDVRGVVSLSAFAHPKDMMLRWLRDKRVPLWPLGYWVLREVQHLIGFSFDDIAPLHTVKAIRVPVMLVHGACDETVPLADLHRLEAAVPPEQLEVCVLPAVGHDLSDALSSAVAPKVLSFACRVVGQRQL
jgi:uncharacterized protein